MSKAIFTTDLLPVGLEVKETFSLIQFTGTIEVSRNLLKKLFGKKRNEYQEILDGFESYAPSEANAILGVQISTSTQDFSNGTFLYVTYIGTPAIIGEIEDN